MFLGGSRTTCFIYDMFSGIGFVLWQTDPAQHLITAG